ncbi:MAG: hypothetical protein ACKO2L_21290 [Planctomycetaceae bacterium]
MTEAAPQPNPSQFCFTTEISSNPNEITEIGKAKTAAVKTMRHGLRSFPPFATERPPRQLTRHSRSRFLSVAGVPQSERLAAARKICITFEVATTTSATPRTTTPSERLGGSPRLCFAPKVPALARALSGRWQGCLPAGCRHAALIAVGRKPTAMFRTEGARAGECVGGALAGPSPAGCRHAADVAAGIAFGLAPSFLPNSDPKIVLRFSISLRRPNSKSRLTSTRIRGFLDLTSYGFLAADASVLSFFAGSEFLKSAQPGDAAKRLTYQTVMELKVGEVPAWFRRAVLDKVTA